MKTTRHSLLAKGIMVLLSLLLLVFAFTYSWFTDRTTAWANGIAIEAKSSEDFEYAIGFYNNGTGGDYKVTNFTNSSTALNLEHLQANDNQYYNLLHDYSPIDVTGDGRTLIRPSMSYGNKEINTASNDYSIAEPNVQYISFDLYFRSKSTGISIKLGDGSWAKGECEINGGSLSSYVGSSASNKSTYGNFSKDAIVGAVRIAFIPYTKNLPSSFANLAAYQDNTPQYLADSASLLWLPKPELAATDSGALTGWTLSTSANNNSHQYYAIFESGSPHTIKTYSNTITTSDISTLNREFTRIDNKVHIGQYYYTKVNVRIWVEGTDSESRRAFSGGKFGVNFKLTTED